MRWLPTETASPEPIVWERPAGQSRPSKSAPRAANSPEARPRVLWADDNSDMRDYVTRLLSERYEVEAVADGEAALAAARAHTPDLVLSDVMMPRLDGFGLVRALRDDPRLGPVPIILLSARAGEEARIEGVAAGADDYLTKPFSARELLARVDAQIKMARFRNEAAQALSLSQQRAELAMSAAGLGAWEWHLDSGDTSWSAETRALLGVEAETPLTRDLFYSLLHPEDVASGRRAEEESLRTGRYLCEYRVALANGQERWIQSRGQRLTDHHGRNARMIGVMADVTDRRDGVNAAQLLPGGQAARTGFSDAGIDLLHWPGDG